jgi:hypothetical protein
MPGVSSSARGTSCTWWGTKPPTSQAGARLGSAHGSHRCVARRCLHGASRHRQVHDGRPRGQAPTNTRVLRRLAAWRSPTSACSAVHAGSSYLPSQVPPTTQTLVTRQLLPGQSAIVDCVVGDATLEEWRPQIEGRGGEMYVVERVCSDESLHRQRVEGRTRDIPGWHEVGWDHVVRMRAELGPLLTEGLTLDSTGSPSTNFDSLQAYLRCPPA